MLILLGILAGVQVRGLPNHWNALNLNALKQVDSDIRYYGRGLVSADSKYLYTPESCTEISTGKSRRFVAQVSITNEHVARKVRLVWGKEKPATGRWKVVPINSLFYGTGDEIGCMVTIGPNTVTPFLGIIGKSVIDLPTSYQTIKRPGLSWWIPIVSSPTQLIRWPFPAPALLDGSNGKVLPLPKNLLTANGVPNGLVSSRKIAYYQNPTFQSKNEFGFGYLDFQSSTIRLNSLPILWDEPQCFFAQSTPHVLADGTFCLSFIRGNRHNRDEYGTAIFDPRTKTWSYFEGLEVCATSFDGRLVAFARYPWHAVRVARVSGG